MDKQQAIDAIRGSSLSGQADLLIEHLLPSARALVQEDRGGTVPDPVSSHLGGLPSLPHDAKWPVWDSRDYLSRKIARLEDKFRSNPRATGLRDIAARMRQDMPAGPIPLAFIGQLNLAELAASAPLEGWPKEGILAVFYGSVSGFDPLERGGSRVLFYPDGKVLAPADPPTGLPESQRFPERKVSFRREWTLPSNPRRVWPKEDYRTLRRQLEPLRRQLASVLSDKEPIHRCAGHPDEIQGDMRLECQLVTNGIFCGDSGGYQDPRVKTLEGGAADWRLLLQVDSDEKLKWMWGDIGRIYFWARQQDIAARDFGGAWAILQCY